jgi:hypothetical protein
MPNILEILFENKYFKKINLYKIRKNGSKIKHKHNNFLKKLLFKKDLQNM